MENSSISSRRGIYEKILGSGKNGKIKNEKMENIMKIVKSSEDSCLIIKFYTQTIENQTKEQRGRLLVCYYVLQVKFIRKCVSRLGCNKNRQRN